MSDGLLALALGSGMLAAVNPCGFALLPAYLSLLVLGDEESTRRRALSRALLLTAAMTLGFVAVFATFGLALAPVASQLQQNLPRFTVVAGLVLAATGLWVLAGRTITLPRRKGRRGAAKPLTGSFWSMAGFGAGYAAASLTCTIAPFLAVVVASFRADDPVEGSILFVAYAVGMGSVVGAVAVAVALAKQSVIGRMRGAGRWVPRVSGALLLAAGAYVAYYGWWELRVLAGRATGSDPVISAAAEVQRLLADAVTAVGPGGWALVLVALVALALLGGRLRSRGDEPAEDPEQQPDRTR
ncbi:cytochrome c biogenesis CcdA family protein [Nocardioides donggukensis]|uniref:Cytochrome c biogenesis protein CcdA n=1 Tax=Nocardioides donggukensis TaxID=2774019 RepID=A0A927K381_9ACTN|nr:cytochrome c biogenesis CcdA family protein [Nocardioides donggukensis]MBD8868773.1 cytochrome c biogenesis protein CcdA [Nocardioides donggukensis]